MKSQNVNVPILGYTKNLTTAAQDLAALGITPRDQSFAKSQNLMDVGRVLNESSQTWVTDRNEPRKNSLQQRDGADSANKSRSYPKPSIDKHESIDEGDLLKNIDKIGWKNMGYNSLEAPKFNKPKAKPEVKSWLDSETPDDVKKSKVEELNHTWEELDIQKAKEAALAQRFEEMTGSGNAGAFPAPFPMLKPARLGISPKMLKKSKTK